MGERSAKNARPAALRSAPSITLNTAVVIKQFFTSEDLQKVRENKGYRDLLLAQNQRVQSLFKDSNGQGQVFYQAVTFNEKGEIVVAEGIYDPIVVPEGAQTIYAGNLPAAMIKKIQGGDAGIVLSEARFSGDKANLLPEASAHIAGIMIKFKDQFDQGAAAELLARVTKGAVHAEDLENIRSVPVNALSGKELIEFYRLKNLIVKPVTAINFAEFFASAARLAQAVLSSA